jgi:hypothetical protein
MQDNVAIITAISAATFLIKSLLSSLNLFKIGDIGLDNVPACRSCGTRADESFAVYELPVQKIKLIYCKNCGKVQGVVNL